jgi:hypothetical protein
MPPDLPSSSWFSDKEERSQRRLLSICKYLLCQLITVVSPFYGLCEIFGKMSTIFRFLIRRETPHMVVNLNWRKYS